jgi:hypothetical protein
MAAKLRRMFLVTAAAVAAWATAAPAHALMRGTDPPGEASCVYDGARKPHGTVITITETLPGGGSVTHQWRCNNGNWEPVRPPLPEAAGADLGAVTLGPSTPNP